MIKKNMHKQKPPNRIGGFCVFLSSFKFLSSFRQIVYNAFERFFLKLISSLFGYSDKEEILFGLDKVVAAIEQKDCEGARNQIETIFKNGIEDINKHCIDYSIY